MLATDDSKISLMGVACFILFFISTFFHSSIACARTVTLVYDDSGSMAGGNRWGYANYGAQTLAALLAEGDSLVTISMQKPASTERQEILADRQQNIVDSLRKKLTYIKDGPTPFEAVDTALRSSENWLLRRGGGNKSIGENDWLVIMTDGVFSEIDPKKATESDRQFVNKKIETVIKNWSDATKGEIRVIFFLIGQKADKTIPELWQQIAPIDVIHAEANKLSITQKMRETAALITGRDKEPVQLNFSGRKPERVKFNSPFPLHRITVFEQKGGHGKLGTLKNLSVNDSDLDIQILPVELKTSKSLRGDNITGKINHLTGEQIFPPGSYTLDFDTRPNAQDIIVFAEAAVSFDVRLYDKKQNEILPVSGNTYEVCDEEPFYVRVSFLSALDNTPIAPDEIGPDIVVKTIFGFQTHLLQAVKGEFYFQAPLTVDNATETLSVETRFPGYFHFKSNILKIKSQVCAKDINIETRGVGTILLPYTWSETMQAHDTFDVVLNADDPKGNYNVTVDGLPDGVTVKFQDVVLSKSNPTREVSVKSGQPIECVILRNRDFRAEEKHQIQLSLTSDNPHVKWIKDRVQFDIQPQPRDISGKVIGDNWSSNVTEIEQAEPVHISCLVKGSPVTPEEMKHWKIESSGKGLDFDISTNETDGQFVLQPSVSAGCACLNKTGVMEHAIILQGPFPGERVELPVQFNIINEPWWEKCKAFLLFIGAVLFIGWWCIGIIRKPRFKKDASVEYTHGKGHPETIWLASGWFFRWIVPYISEKKVVEGIELRPGQSSSSIIVPASQITEQMTIDSVSLLAGDFDKAKDERLYNNSILEVASGRNSEKYMYRQGL